MASYIYNYRRGNSFSNSCGITGPTGPIGPTGQTGQIGPTGPTGSLSSAYLSKYATTQSIDISNNVVFDITNINFGIVSNLNNTVFTFESFGIYDIEFNIIGSAIYEPYFEIIQNSSIQIPGAIFQSSSGSYYGRIIYQFAENDTISIRYSNSSNTPFISGTINSVGALINIVKIA